ncbi:hypothetical protein PHMEG_0004401 [Phytophthora megakarya]|uniref:FLYWCH-type domain-containing protein n=1 Tax=Phytophthora megakarya TaxID=4795 RepID=A0A225WTZ8_9STRA|nr:hypothetical protein PHMEG_0004401 [Phytophthora megakarya]
MNKIQELCPFKTTVKWDGFAYTKARSSGRKTTFSCSYNRSTKCKARVDVMSDGSYQNAVPHTCERPITENTSLPTTEDNVPTVVEDVVNEMKAKVDALAISNLTMVPYGQVEIPPLSVTKPGDATFFQFHYTYMDNGEAQHIRGWGHAALIRLLSYHQAALYLDGIFHCVPSPFYLCLIAMVHARGSKYFVPCMYALATDKSESYRMMQRGFLDALTIILHNHIAPHGINFVITKFIMRPNGEGLEYSESKWGEFWGYFRKTWLEMFPPHLWNIFGSFLDLAA